MPVIIRGKQGGTRKLLTGKHSYKTTYTLSSDKYGSVTLEVWVICTYRKGKRGKYGVEYFAYAVHQVQLSLKTIHQDYRRRFGIESSYRMKNQCRIKTTTKNPIVRFLFVSIAFLIVNLWIYLLWRYVSRSRRGGRRLYPKLFGLVQMLGFLRQAVDRRYGVVEAIYLPDG
jgi:putative transposase